VCKEEGISIARAAGKSAMGNMHLKRANSKNEGDTKMPQDLTWKILRRYRYGDRWNKCAG
jgi:hypothetical protein